MSVFIVVVSVVSVFSLPLLQAVTNDNKIRPRINCEINVGFLVAIIKSLGHKSTTSKDEFQKKIACWNSWMNPLK